ncbi:MAG: hypothetical protein R3B84_22565 [Zavarzinella sp.]
MRFTIKIALVGLVTVVTALPVMAFGRGVAVRGARVSPAGIRTGTAARGVSTGPFGGVQRGAVKTNTLRTPGGVTVQHAAGRGVSRGPLGGVKTGSAGAVRVTGPGGNSVTRGGASGARVGPAGGVRVGGVSGSSVRTPVGRSTVTNRSGVAVGPYGGVRAGSATRSTVATPFGGASVTNRAGVAVGPGGARVGTVGHRTTYYSHNYMRTTGTTVRSTRYGYFTPTWYTAHRTAWVAPRWVAGYNYWRPVPWVTTAAFIGLANTQPIVYNYGSTVIIDSGSVWVNGEKVATTEEYAEQAEKLASTGQDAKIAQDDEFQPLGVFGLIQGEEKTAQRIFQLAVNRAGIIKGNYYDAVADSTLPVAGSIDKKTQRAAWSINNKKDIVFETGFSNFSEDESAVLIHFGKESTQQMVLVRLEEPTEGESNQK